MILATKNTKDFLPIANYFPLQLEKLGDIKQLIIKFENIGLKNEYI